MGLSGNQIERRRVRPVSRSWFSVGVVAILVTLGVASLGVARVYGQQEQKVSANVDSIDRLQERADVYETKVDSELRSINKTLREQHGTLSGIDATLEAIQSELQRDNRDRELRR